MTISFPSLPTTTRLPFAYAEFDPTNASDDPSLNPYTVLLAGQSLPTGTAEDHSVNRPMSKEQADKLFGKGSQLAAMVGAYLKANVVTKMLAIPVPDAPEGETAEGAINITGTVTSAAPVCLYIGGVLVRAAASFGTAGADVATRLAEAVNANPDLPVTAQNSSGQVIFTAKNKGDNGNDIDLRLSYYDEPRPEGLEITIARMSGGAGNPDAAPVIAAMGNDQYHVIGWGWNDVSSLAVLREELVSRWGPIRQIDGQAIIVKRGTFGEATTFSGARNDRHLTVLPSENSPTSPWVDTAASVGVAAHYANSDPAKGFNALPVPGVLAPAEKDRWPGWPEKNQGLFEGLSTRYVDRSGNVCFSKLITTHRFNPLGAEDKAFLSLNSPLTLSYLRHDWNNYLMLKYPRYKLAGDEDISRFDATQQIMTPKLGKAEAIARFGVWLRLGLVEGSGQFADDLIVERNAYNENRLDWLMAPNLMNQFEVAGTLFRHLV